MTHGRACGVLVVLDWSLVLWLDYPAPGYLGALPLAGSGFSWLGTRTWYAVFGGGFF